MARFARLVVPHVPHHVTQRGNRRQQVFFGDNDYRAYLDLLRTWSTLTETRIWAYCLMPNHVHVIAVPPDETGLARTFSETHRRYTRRINFREGWRGHLWQSRFASFAMDEAHLFRCVRYVELNPVRAGLSRSPAQWPWSSAAEHAGHTSERICDPAPFGRATGGSGRYAGARAIGPAARQRSLPQRPRDQVQPPTPPPAAGTETKRLIKWLSPDFRQLVEPFQFGDSHLNLELGGCPRINPQLPSRFHVFADPCRKLRLR